MKYVRTMLVIVLLTAVVIGGYATSEEKKQLDQRERAAQAELNKIKQDMQVIDQQQAALAAEQTALEKDIGVLQGEIRLKDARIEELVTHIDETEQAITVKTDELDAAIKDEVYQNDRMKKRLRTMYKSGNFTYIEILLGADDFSEMMTHLDKIQLLLNYDEETLQQLIDIRQFIAETKRQLEETRQALADMRDEETAARAELDAKHQQLQAKQAQLEREEQALINIDNNMLQTANALTATLKKIENRREEIALEEMYTGGIMHWPVGSRYRRITSPFGMRIHPVLGVRMMHTGIDIAAPGGSPIYAAEAGRVIHTGWLGSYGKAVIIDHGGGIVTLYAHCSRIETSLGSMVERGQRIARIGSTGRSTGNHLHFEVRKNGQYTNPKDYVLGQ